MKILGHKLHYSGSMKPDFTECADKLWKSFWANAGKRSVSRLAMSAKLALVQRSTLPVLAFRWSKWPFFKARCKEIDAIQSKMVRCCLALRPEDGETAECFCRRRNRLAASHIQGIGKWSGRWATDITKWFRHIARNHCNAWHGHLWNILTPSESDIRRAL